MFLPIAALFCSIYLASVHGKKLHEHMTKEEIESVFNVKHDSVHKVDYEIVPIYHKHEYSGGRPKLYKSEPTIQLQAFNRNYTLYLESNDHVLLGSNTPVFIAKNTRETNNINETPLPKIMYARIKYPLPPGFKLYHDMKNKAAVSIYKDDKNKVHVDGTIGNDVVIRPLPVRVHNEVLPKFAEFSKQNGFNANFKSFFDNRFFKIHSEPTHHAVIRLKNNQPNSISHSLPNNSYDWTSMKQQWMINPNNDAGIPFHFSSNSQEDPKRVQFTNNPSFLQSNNITSVISNARRQKWSIRHSTHSQSSKTVYPQLLIVVDYRTYKIHGKNINELSKYIASFINAIDLRFREISYPRVRLNIAGLIIPQRPGAAPYLKAGFVESEMIVASKALSDMGYYFSKEKTFPKDMYDIVVAITNKKMVKYEENGKLNDAISGYAVVEGACKTYIGKAVAIFKDAGGFDGIMSGAHELGHSLGAPHDGDKISMELGKSCLQNDGYIMSYNRNDSKGMHWSDCSKLLMRKFMRKQSAKCLWNKPDVGFPYPKVLPGRLLSRDEQCEKIMGMVSFKREESNCAVLWCAKYDKLKVSFTTFYQPPAEGSYCGEEAICLNAECVKDPELS